MNEEEVRALNQSLQEISDKLRARASRDVETEQLISEFGGRLQAAEQLVATLQSGGGIGFSAFGGPSIGSEALKALGDDASFLGASQAAERNQKIGAMAARVNLEMSLKAALTNDPGDYGSSDGSYIPSQPERGGFVGPALRPLRLLDVLPSRPTSSDAVEFIQLTFTGDASEQAYEGDEKAELDADGTLARAEIVTIAGWLPASKQVLSDHGALQGQIDSVLRHKCLSRLENRIVNGTGGAGKIDGLINQGTAFVESIGTTPADIVGEALVTLADYGYQPGLIAMNPLDWFEIQITRTTTDEEYMFGSPTMPVPPALWNTPIVRSSSVPRGTVLVIDASYTTVLDREQISVMVSNSHEDYFTRNLVAILGELRAGLEVLDPSAVYICDISASSGA